jgi:murein L,D-transpeptidase YafK
MMFQQLSFKDAQLKNQRVKSAYAEKENTIKTYFSEKGLAYDDYNLFLRIFKKEQKLEVWVSKKNKQTYTLLHTYDFCSSSGTLGPKRKEGDLQIPEGIYHINHFNPQSNFLLSLGINYPNAADKIFSDKKNPGGSIYIHGNCVTIGCIPITDDKIKELYLLAVEARSQGQEKIPVHIFPAKLSEGILQQLVEDNGAVHQKFWSNLKTIYADFESNKQLKKIAINTKGEYTLN